MDELYLMSTDAPNSLTARQKPPFGAGFTEEQCAQADKLQSWGTPFSHPEEFVEFRLIKNDEVIFTKRVDGF